MAYGQRICMEQTISNINSCEDLQLKDVLLKFGLLYGLECIKEDLSWYILNKVLSLDQARRVQKLWSALCHDTCKYSLAVCSSFGIPLSQMSPMAMDWEEYNKYDNFGEAMSSKTY